MSAGVVVALVACTVAAWVPGLPIALLALRRTSANVTVVLVAAAGLGLAAWMAIGLPAVHQGWFSRGPLLAAGVGVGAAAWVPARHHVGRLRPRRPGWLAAVLAVLAVVAVALRTSPVYFAYQVADFGEYVNRGNVLADGGRFGRWFVNGFPLVLAESNLLLGEGRTPYVMPFLGLLVGAGVLATMHLAGVHKAVVALVAVPFAVHVHAVWFSQFPASETLYAALLASSVLVATAALQPRDHVAAALAGAFGFFLVVTRGNGLVYLPVVALGLALVPVLTDEARSAVLRTHLLVLAAGLWLGSVYDARHNPRYFLDQQAVPRLPGPVADWFGRLDELPVAAAFTVVVAAGLAAAVGVGVVLDRIRRHPARLRALRLGAVGVVLAGVLAAHLFVITPASYLPRYEALGAPVFAAAGLAVAVWFADALRDGVTRFLVAWPLLVGTTMATFQATRMRKSMTVDAQWFLYWDRYFFSEAFPMLLLAGGVAGGVLVATTSGRAVARRAVLGAGGVLLVVAVVDMVPPTWRSGEHVMFDDTYEELAAIDALMPEAHPVIYDGPAELPEGWFWANTSRVLADPLVETFGHPILNLAGPLGPDGRPSPDEITDMLDDVDARRGYLLQVQGSGRWEPVTPTLDPRVLGEVHVPIERLEGRSAVRPEDQEWSTTTVHVRVVEVAVGRDGAIARSRP